MQLFLLRVRAWNPGNRYNAGFIVQLPVVSSGSGVKVTSMAVISLSNAQLAFGHVPLLDHAEFSLEAGERVGLIGRNGTGKSSLLKIIAGVSKLDDGLLVMQQNLKIAYVDQEPHFAPEMTVFDAVASGLGELPALLNEYEALTGQFGG